jgi:hypothetical protein
VLVCIDKTDLKRMGLSNDLNGRDILEEDRGVNGRIMLKWFSMK